ncbi:MAG: hypothetical protein KF901_06780 [Myxococcales bacterium]|nr:hypothetical protein [Myxococcales bacterium]
MTRVRAIAIAMTLLGCVDEGGSAGTYCRDSRQCRGALICVSLVCREAPRASEGVPDAAAPADGGTSEPRDAAVVDAAVVDAPLMDADVDADATDAGVDAGAPDAGPADPCEPIVDAGHLLCVRQADRCEAVFQGRGNTCAALCALAGLVCTASYADDDMGLCTYDEAVAFACMDGNRMTDHCICERP